MLIVYLFRNGSLGRLTLKRQHQHVNVNIARKITCYISKSKLILSYYNAFYFSEIASMGFTLHEIK